MINRSTSIATLTINNLSVAREAIRGNHPLVMIDLSTIKAAVIMTTMIITLTTLMRWVRRNFSFLTTAYVQRPVPVAAIPTTETTMPTISLISIRYPLHSEAFLCDHY